MRSKTTPMRHRPARLRGTVATIAIAVALGLSANPATAAPSDGNGNKAVNYSGLIPVLLEAIKEQQAQIEILREEITLLKEQ